MKKYVVYLTRYKGTLLPKWYIGSTTEYKVLNGYNGSVKSKKYRPIYDLEQRSNKHLFKTRILSYHRTREQALAEELRLQRMHKVVANTCYFNEGYASVHGYFGRDVKGKLNPNYGHKWTKTMKSKLATIRKGTKYVFDTKHNKTITVDMATKIGKRYLSVHTKGKCSIVDMKTNKVIYDFVTIIDNIRYKALSKGVSRGLSIVDIFDSEHNLRYTSDKPIRIFLKEKNLPRNLDGSKTNNGIPIYQNVYANKTRLLKSGMLKYKGWYAIKRPKMEKVK